MLVTGGSRGIGRAIAEAFARAGDRVFVASRTRSSISRWQDGAVISVRADVRRTADLRAAVGRATSGSRPLDVLVNAAGYSRWLRLERITEHAWNDMVDTNLKGVLFASKVAVPRMRRGGSIINVSSLAGKRGSAQNALYCATKFGVNGITQALAKELGPRGIRVNAICPVYVPTQGLLEALSRADAPAAGRSVQAFLREFAATQTALGALPTVAQVAQTCIFLASPAASAITGQCINVDCGALPQ